MLVQYLILILVYVSVSCADEIDDVTGHDVYNLEKRHVGDETERVSSDELSKLYMLVKNIESKLELSIEHKLKNVEKMIPELEDNMDRKLNRLEKKILDKLEDFIESKLKGLEIDIPEKLHKKINDRFDALEKNNLINAELNKNFSLSVLEKETTDIEKSLYRKFDTLDTTITYKIKEINIIANDRLDKLSQKLSMNQNCTFGTLAKAGFLNSMNRMLDVLNEKIPSLEKNITQKLDLLDKKLPSELEYNVTETLDAIVKKVPDLELSINRKFNEMENIIGISLDKLDKKICKNLTENVNGTINALSKLLDIENSINSKLNVSYTKIADFETYTKQTLEILLKGKSVEPAAGVTPPLDAAEVKIPVTEQNVNRKVNESETEDKKELLVTFWTTWEGHCKSARLFPYADRSSYGLDDIILNYASLSTLNSADNFSFYMDFAARINEDSHLSRIQLAYGENRYAIKIARKNAHSICIELYAGFGQNYLRLKDINCEPILTQLDVVFTPLYINIKNGKLEVGQEGQAPLITHEANYLHSINYFDIPPLNSSARDTAFFDCP